MAFLRLAMLVLPSMRTALNALPIFAWMPSSTEMWCANTITLPPGMVSHIFQTDIDVACLQFGHAGASTYVHLHWRVCPTSPGCSPAQICVVQRASPCHLAQRHMSIEHAGTWLLQLWSCCRTNSACYILWPFVTMCDYLHLTVYAGTPTYLHSVDHAALQGAITQHGIQVKQRQK